MVRASGPTKDRINGEFPPRGRLQEAEATTKARPGWRESQKGKCDETGQQNSNDGADGQCNACAMAWRQM